NPLSSISLTLPIPVFYHRGPAADRYTLSLHDALPILTMRRHARLRPEIWVGKLASGMSASMKSGCISPHNQVCIPPIDVPITIRDRRSTRLNSSHVAISYAVFCLKKKRQWGRGGESGR